MSQCAERVLGSGHGVKGMPLAEHIDLPGWCQHIGTTKLLSRPRVAGSSSMSAVPGPLKSLEAFAAEGLVKGIDGIFVTHVPQRPQRRSGGGGEAFSVSVYGIPEVAPVLARPGDWFLPGVSPNAVDPVVEKKDGDTMAMGGVHLHLPFLPRPDAQPRGLAR